MEAIFKKYFWVVKLVGIAAASGLAASAVATQLGTSMALGVGGASADEEGEEGEEGEEDEEDEDSPNPFAAKPRSSLGGAGRSVATAKRKTAENITARNIFCPTCVPEEAAPVIVPGQADAGTPGLRPGEVKTTLPLRLMATMEATDPVYSLATVYDGDAGITGLYGVEDEIRPGVLVVGIDSGVLHIRNNAAFEYVQMGEAEQPRPTPRRDKKDDDKKPRRKKNSRAIDGAEDSINCPNDNLCIVERQFVEKLMGNPALLAKQARIVPSQKNGETQGFKFYGIRRGSLPRLLGLKNGDMLTDVNGESLNSMDQAMGLVMKLRRASNVTVTLVRKGKTINKEIQIQ